VLSTGHAHLGGRQNRSLGLIFNVWTPPVPELSEVEAAVKDCRCFDLPHSTPDADRPRPAIGSPDAWVAMRAIYEVTTENEALVEEFAEHDAVYLLQFNTGPVQLICREPIEAVEDFEGRRIRAVGPYIEAFQALGAEIVSFPQIEVYQALDSGLVDCNQVYWSNVTAYRLHEVADYLVQLDYGQMLGLVGVINKQVWDSLSEDQQALLREAGSDAVDFLARELLALEDQVKGELQEGIDGHSVEIRSVPDDVMAVVLEQGDGLADTWLEAVEGKGLEGKAVLDHFMEAQERYAAELEANGYPWN
jgi:TRAP-type transport system periplasmic protein